jgi:hypothetical protein
MKHSKVDKGRHLSKSFPNHNGLKKEMLYDHWFSTFALECAFRKVQENQVGLKLNETHRLLAYADDVNLLEEHKRKTLEL